jgi:hypothetical protein
MIDEDRTMQLFGYTSDELGPKSSKKIVAVCEECGKYRVMVKHGYRDLCIMCSRHRLPIPEYVSEENRFVEGTGIDRIKTISEFGYDPADIKSKSQKKVVVKCIGCNEYRTTGMSSAKSLCIRCAAIKRDKLPMPVFVEEEDRFIEGTFIDRIETIKRFGYDPLDLVSGSGKKVVVMCKECRELRVLIRQHCCDTCTKCTHLQRGVLPEPNFVAEEDRFIKGTQIDRILTIDKFGYDPIDVPPDSYKDVIIVCKECGNHRILRRNRNKDFCIVCTSLDKQYLINHDFIPEENRFIENTLIDRIETRKKFGYDPLNLSIAAHRSVCTKCRICGEYRVVRRQTCGDLCAACAHTIRAKNYPMTYQQRKELSMHNQCVTEEEWTGFSTHDWRTWHDVTFINEWFEGCHRHHITKTIVAHIPADLHNSVYHNLKTGENMETINALALQFVGVDT